MLRSVVEGSGQSDSLCVDENLCWGGSGIVSYCLSFFFSSLYQISFLHS